MKEQETVIKRTEQLDIDGMIFELLQEQCTDGENVKFTDRAVDLIHKISEKCQVIPIVKETQEQAKDYAAEMTAEQIYLDMLIKIVEAPTKIHMRLAARMLIPIIDRKLEEGGL